MSVEEINIKENMPTVIEAMDNLKSSLERLKRSKVKAVQIIHGYGSTGVGGAICKAARQYLKAQERNGKLKAVIFGENFDMFNDKSRELKAKYNELDQYYGKGNNGITVVEV